MFSLYVPDSHHHMVTTSNFPCEKPFKYEKIADRNDKRLTEVVIVTIGIWHNVNGALDA